MIKGSAVWQAIVVALAVTVVPGVAAHIQERKLVPTQMNLVNKPGGGSAVAYNYINQHPGNGHFLVMGSRLMEADEWKNELETNFWRANLQGSAETRKFLAKDYQDARAFLSELGLAK